ncbi:Heterogeneous nuclear ribonucleoprotein K [Dirofilaria immitis]|nr:Heterogeneous nuclear ribonucleoprotein K [Dirofilaria immitis]
MKRSGGDRFGSGSKRTRMDSYEEALANGKYELRLVVTSRGAGGIIGRGGENIKRLRSELALIYKANAFWIGACPGSYLLFLDIKKICMQVQSPWFQDFRKVQELVRPLLFNGLKLFVGGLSNMNYEIMNTAQTNAHLQFDANLTVPDSQTPERVLTLTATTENIANCLREIIPRLDEKAERPDSEMKVLVHESHAGAVIGRGGSRIKELREKLEHNSRSYYSFLVFSRCAPQSTERIVLLNGEVEKIIDCINIIIDVLKEIPIKGPVRPYDPMYYDPDMISDYGGYVPDRNFISRVGRGRDYGFGSGMIPSRYPGRDDRYSGMRDMMGRYSPIPAMQTTQVTIPDELGGAIIGKGGSRINRVREESGAQIEVEPHRDNGGDRIITISGTREQIQAAQYLLQQCVRTSEAGRRYLSEH